MRKISLIILAFTLFNTSLFAQNVSNKGTDFWIGYTGHIDGLSSQLDLYITSDVSTTGMVTVPLSTSGWSAIFSVTANQTTIISVPPAVAYDGNSGTIENQGIHVTSVLPIVVYSHIFASERSDATLVLPVPALGKEYYTIGFTQTSGAETGVAEFMVVGVQDSTHVDITPTQATTDGHAANVTFPITINQGQVYQLQSNTDLTGSHIVTYSNNNSSCNTVAVFSGSTWDALGCPGQTGMSGDNLYQQMYPVNAWGKDFITCPYRDRVGGDYFRVLADSDTTVVTINGGATYTLNTGQFHDTLMTTANYITATKPITLAQYQRSQTGCDATDGDPSMTILNPVYQTLDTITVYSTTNYQIVEEFINVIIRTDDAAAFRLDGNPVPFKVVPSNKNYSYSQDSVASGNHTLTSDSGFNAIAYGFGDVESYGYNAGSNVKSLALPYVIANSNGIQSPHLLCNGAVVNFSTGNVTPTTIKWYFGDGDTSSLLKPVHTYNTPGSYIISYVTTSSVGNACGSSKDSASYNLTITNFTNATFSYSATCPYDSVSFSDSSALDGNAITSWNWNFGDGGSSTLQNPKHHYPSVGSYNVTMNISTAVGCIATATKTVTIAPLPTANAGTDKAICGGGTTTIGTTSLNGYTYLWTPPSGLSSINDANPVASPSVNTTYTLIVTNALGCSGSDSVSVMIYPSFSAFAGPSDTLVCPNGKITLHASGGVSYSWQPASSLSDAGTANPTATVTGLATYTVTVTNSEGCTLEKNASAGTYPVTIIIAGPDTIICPNQPLVLTASGASTYQWSAIGGEILSCANCSSASVSTNTPGNFMVTGTDAHGCPTSSDTVEVLFSTICKFVVMPTAFSPNGDGKNDIFRPKGNGVVKVEYYVYDRWGEKIFTGTDLVNGWDGTFKGKPQPVGSYAWMLTATMDDGTTTKLQGNVTLVR